jgi:very-short-patch-repair endonuclease
MEYSKIKNLDDRKFRRQYSIDKYIVDPRCPSEKPVIELDGAPKSDYLKIHIEILKDINRNREMITYTNQPPRPER